MTPIWCQSRIMAERMAQTIIPATDCRRPDAVVGKIEHTHEYRESAACRSVKLRKELTTQGTPSNLAVTKK